MANAFYPKFRKAQNNGNATDLTTATLKWVMVDTGLYTYSAAHEFLSDIPEGARLETTGALTGVTISDAAVLDAADPALPDGGGGETGEALVLFVDTGSAATSRLILYIDTDATGLPWTSDSVADTIAHGAGFASL